MVLIKQCKRIELIIYDGTYKNTFELSKIKLNMKLPKPSTKGIRKVGMILNQLNKKNEFILKGTIDKIRGESLWFRIKKFLRLTKW